MEYHYVIIVLLSFHWSNVNGQNKRDFLELLKDGSKNFQKELTKLVNVNLGHETLQKNLDDMSEDDATSFDDQATLDNFVEDLAGKTTIAENVLNEMASHILEDYKTSTGDQRPIESCCQFDDSKLGFFSVFGENVSMSDICEQTPPSNSKVCPSLGSPPSESIHYLKKEDLVIKCKDVYKVAKGEARNIQYDSLDGYSFTYPAYQDPSPMECTCAQRDPRFSSRLAETLAGNEGRHFVIVLDYSEKIQNTIDIMRKVATTLLKLFTSKDMISVKFYHEDNLVPADKTADCLKISSKATPYLKDKILGEIKTKQPKGDAASYSKVFRESFTALQNDNSNQTEKHFIFVTSGHYIDNWSEIDQVFKERRKTNSECNDMYFSLLLINDGKLPKANFVKNKKLKEGCNDNFIDFELSGDNNHLTINSKISEILPSGENIDDKVHYIMPISDRFGRGTTIDACKAVVDKSSSQNPVKGVVCLSFLTNEFIREEWSQTENSYWFLIKRNGQTFIHPKFGQPLGSDELSRTVSILQTESSQSFKDEVYNNMISGVPGSKTLSHVMKPISRGPFGATSQNKTLTYTWKAVPKSDFIMTIVTSSDYEKSELKITNQGGKENYHRIDLIPDNYANDLCKYSSEHVATKDLSVIKFPADAFQRPSFYFKLETNETVKELNDLFTPGNTATPPDGLFKDMDVFNHLRQSVQATHLMEGYWKNDTSEAAKNTLTRYIGMHNGFFRTFPGHLMNPSYDPRARPWYRLMIAQKGITLTTPYPDAFTGENVMTLGKVLLKGKKSVEKAGNIAMDFKPLYFKVLLERSINECKSGTCVVIDRNGFVVYQSSFMEENENSTLENQHIVKMHGRLAKTMIENGVMIKNYCLEFRNNVTVKEWFYSLDHVIEAKSYSKGCLKDYHVVPIIDSNLLLLYINDRCDVKEKCTCREPINGERFGNCSNDISETNCECPCIQPVTCLSDLRITSNTLECNPEDKRKTDFSGIWYTGDETQLDLCMDLECKTRDTLSECNRFKAGCNWCHKYPSGASATDDKKYCEYSDKTCFEHLIPKTSPSPPKKPGDKDGLSKEELAGIIVGCLIFIFIILAIVYFKRKSINRKPPAKSESTIETNNNAVSNAPTLPRQQKAFTNFAYVDQNDPDSFSPTGAPKTPLPPEEDPVAQVDEDQSNNKDGKLPDVVMKNSNDSEFGA